MSKATFSVVDVVESINVASDLFVVFVNSRQFSTVAIEALNPSVFTVGSTNSAILWNIFNGVNDGELVIGWWQKRVNVW